MDQELVNRGLNLVDQLTAALKATAPQMVDLTLAAVKFDSLFSLAVGFIVIVAAGYINFGLIPKLWKLAIKEANSTNDPTPLALPVFSHALTLILVIPGVSRLLNQYAWAALFDPRVSLAMRALDKVLEASGSK